MGGQSVGLFKTGRKKITYLLITMGFIWVYAGDIGFTIKQKLYMGKQAISGLMLPAIARKSYDWIYKIRDHFSHRLKMHTFSPCIPSATPEGVMM